MKRFICDACGRAIFASPDGRRSFMTCPGCGALVDTDRRWEVPGTPTAARLHDAVTPTPRPDGNHDSTPEMNRAATAVLCFLIGVFMFIFFVGFLIAAGIIFQTSFPERFLDRGWTPYAAMLLTFWSMAILGSRVLLVRRRSRALTHNYFDIPVTLGDTAGVDAAIADLRRQASLLNDTLVGPRLVRALERFRASPKLDAASEALREAGDLAYNQSHADYTPVRVFLWTIPILGFLGTVLGIGTAIGGFTGFLAAAQEVDAIKQALGDVSAGLGVAFDTTMVGLVLSIAVMFAMSAVERMERAQLQDAEERCITQLIPRLSAGTPAAPEQRAMAERIVEELRTAIRQLLSETGAASTNLPQLSVRTSKTPPAGRYQP